MKVSKLECKVFKRQVFVVQNCSAEKCTAWIKKSFNFPESADVGPDGGWSGATITLLHPMAGAVYIVWIEDTTHDDISAIEHEAVHVANAILDYVGAGESERDTELAAYYITFWINEIRTACLAKEIKKAIKNKKSKKGKK